MPSYYVSEDLARFAEMSKANEKGFADFMRYYSGAMEAGLVDAKTKQLIGLAVAFAIQEPYCIHSYAKQCADAGWSPEEMAEAANVAASIKAGGVVAHWVQACNVLERET